MDLSRVPSCVNLPVQCASSRKFSPPKTPHNQHLIMGDRAMRPRRRQDTLTSIGAATEGLVVHAVPKGAAPEELPTEIPAPPATDQAGDAPGENSPGISGIERKCREG